MKVSPADGVGLPPAVAWFQVQEIGERPDRERRRDDNEYRPRGRLRREVRCEGAIDECVADLHEGPGPAAAREGHGGRRVAAAGRVDGNAGDGTGRCDRRCRTCARIRPRGTVMLTVAAV